MTNESRESSMSRGFGRGRSARLPAALGLAGIAFLSTVGIGATSAQTPLPPSRVESTSYVVELSPNGTYQSGLPSSAILKIASKTPYQISKDFPWTINLLNPPTDKVLYTKKSLTRADGVFTDSTATFKVGFVPGAVGKQTLVAAVNLQVCAPGGEKPVCVTNWVNVSLTVDIIARQPKVNDEAKPQ
ncbi:MAG: hypothetical protein U0359_41130 [Byssovorax sp.]